MTSEIFRANVGIMIAKGDDVLVFERFDIQNAWQLPQGGINRGEAPLAAAFRELEEETGIKSRDVKVISEYPEWLAYELPNKSRIGEYIGQVQRWFIFELLVNEDAIRLDLDAHQEFRSYKWIPLYELEEIAVSFRKPIYKKLVAHVQSHEQ